MAPWRIPARRLGSAAAAAAVSAAAAGCDGAPFSTLSRSGETVSGLTTLGWTLIVLVSLLILVMGVLVLWGALRNRGTLSEHLPIDIDGGKGWILIGGVIIPVVVLSALYFVTLLTLRTLPATVDDPDVSIGVTAHQWWWEVDYLYPGRQRFSTANEIHVPVGASVQVTLKAADVIHSFWVPRLFGKADAIPGHTSSLVFRADEPGTYRGECAEYCGVQHANMRFVVVVQEPDEYEQWARRQRLPAAPPTSPLLTSGRNLFEQSACGLCHTVRGTDARGGVAPDLTHVGSRMLIGAGTLPNTRARLQAWIVDAQALKPGVRMPTLEVFEGRELNALTAYLESLE